MPTGLTRRSLCTGAGALALSGCAGWHEPGGDEPVAAGFDLIAAFAGERISSGTITTAFVMTRRFTATLSGKRSGDELTLLERFDFADGTPLQVWRLRQTAPGRYAGTVETEFDDGTMAPKVDVEGFGDATGVQLAYDGYAPGGGRTLLGFRHHMRSVGDERIKNHVTIAKFGLPLATSQVLFVRV